mgnify:CR=1 FL=1|jgi:crossover junction endodeoxyribonuclease RusA|tara:strand:+ start:938 stop:1342 length:405 start_codon:yes stop_codon:yes gene_type:complete
MADITIQLPWTDPALLPNERNSWGKFAKINGSRKAKKQRKDACDLTREALNGKTLPDNIFKCIIHTIYHPPTGRGGARDEDNRNAALKSAFDGIADALGVDDRIFSHTSELSNKVGRGVIFITVRIFTKDEELK